MPELSQGAAGGVSFFGTAWRAVQAGREYSGAVEAARAAYASGEALPDVVRAFSRETEGTFDDEAADILEAGLRRGAEGARQAAVLLGRFAGAIEQHGPAVFLATAGALTWIVTRGPVWIERARAVLARIEAASDRTRGAAASAGTVAVRVSVRLDALLRTRT